METKDSAVKQSNRNSELIKSVNAPYGRRPDLGRSVMRWHVGKKKPKEPQVPFVMGGVAIGGNESYKLAIVDPSFSPGISPDRSRFSGETQSTPSLSFRFVNDSPLRLDFVEIDFILYRSAEDGTILETTTEFLFNIPENSVTEKTAGFNKYGRVIVLDAIRVMGGSARGFYRLAPSGEAEPTRGAFKPGEAWRITDERLGVEAKWRTHLFR